MKKLLRLVFLVVFVVSTVLLGRQMLDKKTGSASYEEALKIATQEKATVSTLPAEKPVEEVTGEPVWIPEPVEDDPELEKLKQIDLAALREVNPDVVGWIRIPGTQIDYPLMQGEDNEFYLKHTWLKEKNSVGSAFLEWRNNPDLTDYNTIVYGHNMNDGSMFADMTRFYDNAFRKEHPYIYIVSDAGIWRYEIFAYYKAWVDDPTYGLSFHQIETKAKFLLHATEKSVYDTEIIPLENDRILTLSTCTASSQHARWVLQARLKMMQKG